MTDPKLSRRHAFKIAGLAGAAAAFGGRHAYAGTPVPAVMPQGAGYYRTHVGALEVTVVSDGAFPLGDAYPTFGANASKEAVAAVLDEAFLEPTGLMGQVNVVLVRRGDGPYTLIDTGCGKLFGPATGFMLQNLAAAGVKPDDVGTVLLTHLHPDHAGGAAVDGKPLFTKAEHWANEEEVKFWTSPAPDFSRSGVPEDMRGMMVAGATAAIKATNLRTFAASNQVAPGVTAVPTGGHTPGHCVVRIEDGGQTLMYVTDLLIHYAIVAAHPEWFVGFDTDREQTVTVRKKLFAELAKNRTMICGSHLPFPSLGHLRAKGDGYEYVSAQWKWA